MIGVTELLASIQDGDSEAYERLLPLIYEELRVMAALSMSRERPGQTLQATALVHETYLRLFGTDNAQSWSNRRHFFGAAGQVMRRILLDNARRKARVCHGGDFDRVNIDFANLADTTTSTDLIAIDQALTRLSEEEPAAAKLVEMRFFAGLTIEESAEALGLSVRTANRRWAFAKAWLSRELSEPSYEND